MPASEAVKKKTTFTRFVPELRDGKPTSSSTVCSFNVFLRKKRCGINSTPSSKSGGRRTRVQLHMSAKRQTCVHHERVERMWTTCTRLETAHVQNACVLVRRLVARRVSISFFFIHLKEEVIELLRLTSNTSCTVRESVHEQVCRDLDMNCCCVRVGAHRVVHSTFLRAS